MTRRGTAARCLSPTLFRTAKRSWRAPRRQPRPATPRPSRSGARLLKPCNKNLNLKQLCSNINHPKLSPTTRTRPVRLACRSARRGAPAATAGLDGVLPASAASAVEGADGSLGYASRLTFREDLGGQVRPDTRETCLTQTRTCLTQRRSPFRCDQTQTSLSHKRASLTPSRPPRTARRARAQGDGAFPRGQGARAMGEYEEGGREPQMPEWF